jgi:hypothetical protein
VVRGKVFRQIEQQFDHRGVAVEVNAFVFDAAPKLLHTDVVVRPTPAAHAEVNALPIEHARKNLAVNLLPWSLLNTTGLPCSR